MENVDQRGLDAMTIADLVTGKLMASKKVEITVTDLIYDMPKLFPPMERGRLMDCNGRKGKFLVIPGSIVLPEYAWIKDPRSFAVEKLDGTNVAILIKGSEIISVWNRETLVRRFENPVIEMAIAESYRRKYLMLGDGLHFGEVIGKGVGNSYGLKKHVWIPFRTYACKKLKYNSWNGIDKTYEGISEWMKELPSLYHRRCHSAEKSVNVFAEGAVIYLIEDDGTLKMTKLRRDMFDWYKGYIPLSKRSSNNVI